MYIQKRNNLKYDLTVQELNEFFSNDSLIKSEIDYQLNLLNELHTEAKINHKLYIEKTIKAPNIALAAMSFVHPTA